jgi:UDP-2,4-diacetamido-2,4,6-trideoxy-beta-L-altropyranose hydrolase
LKFYFRTDASESIGFGHIVRCISLAKEIKRFNENSEIWFIINDDYRAKELVSLANFQLTVLCDDSDDSHFLLGYFPTDKDRIIVIDNLRDYSVDTIKELRRRGKTILVHSYSDARFYCDLAIYPAGHLDSTFLEDPRWNLSDAELVSGIEYCLLNQDILLQDPRREICIPPKIISVVAGGTDPSNSLLRIFDWMNEYDVGESEVQFLYGQGVSYTDEIAKKMTKKNIKFKQFTVDDFAKSDLAICAFGVTVYELVYLNIPSITFGHTPKHVEASKRFSEKFRCTWDFGSIVGRSKEEFSEMLGMLMKRGDLLHDMHSRTCGLVDGQGVRRIAFIISSILGIAEHSS